MNTIENNLATAKLNLKNTLSHHAGDTKNAAVIAAIETLVKLNPTKAPARNAALRDGHWLMINAPSFPGGQPQANGQMAYSLGRMSFGMFQPKDLLVQLDRVSQPIEPIANTTQHTHDIIAEFTIVDRHQPTVSGVVKNLGICEPNGDDTLRVQFTGGTLEPKADTDRADWQAVFGDQSAQPQPLKAKLMDGFLRLMFGLVGPTSMDTSTGIVTYEMRRSPKGNLKLLYLDNELRITKGEKGTVLVATRQ
ncbi:fimbrial protein [filamentous cyanobacterium LEGE 11480]|uniref:Fimbrial protein n=1 Tax=Romeriopsis navalis LEGE 11480 TaxID=2777977 RepID=A0A928VTZ2_9CYAN|nr:PAP/fibrillin family protein [Romeriopsis navalis]MBE9032497.1 fimbrial protein [Romeriopsis navalis LEGE 11480]